MSEEDKAYISPLDQETAQKVLKAADKAKVDHSRVLTQSYPPAFVVPHEVEDAYHELFDADEAKKSNKASPAKS